MTAIVGILNHRGIAFAADSAATHKSDSGTKITNHANKIFAISKYKPVGVAIYNNLAFMDVPWESIIKKFRSDLGNKGYSSLKEYAQSFWKFVSTFCTPHFPELQLAYMDVLVTRFFNDVNNQALKEIGGTLSEDNKSDYYSKLTELLNGYKLEFGKDKAEGFKKYSCDQFEKYAKTRIDNTISHLVSDTCCPKEFRKVFIQSLYSFVCSPNHTYLDKSYTGLVFFGYGENEVFPSFEHYVVTYAIDNKIKYTLAQEYHVVNASSAIIAPFAQSDVTNTVIRAVEDDLRKKFYDSFETAFTGFRDDIVSKMKESKAPEDFIEIIQGIKMSEHVKKYKEDMDVYIKKTYQNPLIETVTFLSKEDLADLAESLVRMTCIKRHFSNTDETVGGPVDVAVVTQGDGFIWMKRKHYFDADLNHNFFDR